MKLVCFNVDQRMAYPAYAKMIIDLLASMRADVIVLQEVMQWKHVEALATALGMNWNREAWFWGGQAVISQYPILECWKRVIPKSWRNAVVGIRVAPAGAASSIWIFSVHLTDLKFHRDETERLRETDWILQNLPKAVDTGRAVIAGDFNSVSHLDQSTDKLLASRVMQIAGWSDAQAGRKWTRGTWIPATGKNTVRIDRIYTRGAIAAGRGGIVDQVDLGLKRWPTGRDHRLLWNFL